MTMSEFNRPYYDYDMHGVLSWHLPMEYDDYDDTSITAPYDSCIDSTPASEPHCDKSADVSESPVDLSEVRFKVVEAEGASCFKVEQWAEIVPLLIEDFKGDRQQTAEIFHAFMQGANYVHEAYLGKSVAIDRPSIAVISESRAMPGYAGTNPYESLIYLDGKMIEALAGQDLDALYNYTNQPDRNQLTISTRNFFICVGAEEAHHNILNQKRGPSFAQEDFERLSDVEYHAEEREWQALRWKRRIAKDYGMPQEVQDYFKNLHDAALEIRRQRRGSAT